ncbi:MAG TPA: glycosyltransferase [Chitinophagaceae bacterium]
MNKETKTLIILTPGFPANEADTTCIPPQQIFVKALKKIDPSLNIIVLAFQYPFVSKKYKWHGVDVISFNGRNKGKLYRAMIWQQVWQTLKKIKKENTVTGILNFWLGECALIGKYFAKRNGIKQFTWILGQDAKNGNRYFSLIKPQPDTLIAVSDFVSAEFLKNYSIKPSHVIPVGIDVSIFRQEKFTRNIDVMGAGSLISLKKYDVFIKIIKELRSSFPDINSIICGEGEEKENLQVLINDLGLQKNITLPGEVPHSEVIRLMQRSKIFLHTSAYEGFGSVCSEALFAGCQVISFCKPMHKNFEHHHVVNTESEMVEKTLEIMNNPNVSHASVLNYSIEDIAQKVKDIFN